jgi:hypothetical protein
MGGEVDNASSGRRLRTQPVLLLVPALILAVAAVHAVRVMTLDQSSWKGGGFGMFATYDHEVTRAVVILVDRGDGFEVADPGPDDGDTQARLRALPRERDVTAYAHTVLSRLPDARRVVIEVRGHHLDGTRLSFPVLSSGEASR